MVRSLTVFILVSAAAVLVLFAASRVPPKTTAPVVELQLPTPQPVLERLKKLGAEWKLNRFGQVDWLFLKRLPLSDDDLAILRSLPEVKTLNMRGIQTIKGHQFTDDGLRHLVNLKKLEKLDLSANYQLTDEASLWLGQLTSLRWLNIGQTRLTEASLPHLSQLRNLREFGGNEHFELNHQTVEYFARMPLARLGVKVSPESYPLLPRLKYLSKAPIASYETVLDTNLQFFSHIHGIEHFRVSLTNGWSDASQLQHLRGLRKLKKLTIPIAPDFDGEIDREGIRSLADIPSLRQLIPEQFNDEVLDALSECPQIQWLDLRSPARGLTPKGLFSLARMPNLKAILLPPEYVTAETLNAVSRIRSLEMLSLKNSLQYEANSHQGSPKVNREFPLESLRRLSQLPNLRILLIDNWNLGEEALTTVARMDSLESLSMSNGNTARGQPIISEASLLQLRHLPHLAYINFHGTQTSLEAAERLREFLPTCYIEDAWCCGCMSMGSPPAWWRGGATPDIDL